MGSIYPGCETSVHDLNPDAIVCSEQHCDKFTESDTFHKECDSFGKGHPLYPISTAECINTNPPHDITEPVLGKWGYACPDGYANLKCYCCCSCLANGTPIAIPEGVKAIEQFAIGDAVTVGDWRGHELSWTTGSVKFSSGSDAGWKNTMMFIEIAGKKQVIASVDHLFFLASGKLKRADRLVPHKDHLMGSEGQALEVLSSISGSWDKGLHHIATDMHFDGSLKGHLINSAGVVSGDYCLQINQHELVKMGLMDSAENTPAHGSRAFADANPHLEVTRASAVKSGENLAEKALPQGFTAFDPNGSIYIPAGAAQFLTDAQATDIVNNSNASFRDLTSESGLDAVNFLLKVFKGFYPSINFLVDVPNPNFNTYGFEMYGQKHLVISGEITRLNGLYADGYKFIIAQGIARLLGSTPKDQYGFTYTAAADFYAVSSIFREVFFLDSNDLINNAPNQIKTVFGYISPANAAGDPNNLANDPSIDCRIGSINTGIFGGGVLPCACDDLALVSAVPDASEPYHLRLELNFNKAIDPLSIKDLYNYKFLPPGYQDNNARLPKVLAASLSPLNPSVVVLQLQSPLDIQFTVFLTDVWGANGSVLGEQNNASFAFMSHK
ncbi:hypothetical protein J4P02_01565 [Pseudomonas sp. NFXW11]|uniref:hypothetical protein n=1 Tax=Pseudomonas sp. NFXW11 TaxID=2819531 RepID=UPI003CF7521A